MLAFDRPPYLTTSRFNAVNESERQALARGVTWRAVYAQQALELPGRLDHVQAMTGFGEQARAATFLPLKLEIVDRKVAVLPLDLHDPDLGGGALIVRPSSLLDALLLLFESIWDRATPLIGHPGEQPERSTGAPAAEQAEQVDRLVPLLAAGLKDHAIARHLGLSERTLQRRLRTLLTGLHATTRFQAGYQTGYQAGNAGGHRTEAADPAEAPTGATPPTPPDADGGGGKPPRQ